MADADHDRTIEYFYSAHSAYAYLGAWELARHDPFVEMLGSREAAKGI